MQRQIFKKFVITSLFFINNFHLSAEGLLFKSIETVKIEDYHYSSCNLIKNRNDKYFFIFFGIKDSKLPMVFKSGIEITPDQGISVINDSSLSIGDNYQGGIIFRLDASGEHGLIASKKIIDTKISRKENNEITTFARVDGIGADRKNTMILVAVRIGDKDKNFATEMTEEYSVQEDGKSSCSPTSNIICYDDWYLPSRYELNLMYKNLNKVGLPGYSSVQFISSHDLDTKDPWEQHEFDDANPFGYDNDLVYIYPIRSF